MDKKILIVEDDATIQKTIQIQLTSIGFNSFCLAANGEEAIQKVAEFNPDLIIMDIKIKGGIDGIETISIIKEKYDVPVIYLTAHSDESIIDKAKKTNPYGYLVKPVDKRDLKIAIEIALYKHNLDKELKISEERYRAIVEDQTELICRYDIFENISFVNHAFCNYFNEKKESLLNKNIFSVIKVDEKSNFKERIKDINKGNPVIIFEEKILLTNGLIRWLRWTNRAIFDNQDKIIEYQSVGFDITDKKTAEDELISEKERLAVTLRSINDGVIATNTNGEVILMNKIAELITGWTQNDAIGKSLKDIFFVIDEKNRKPYDDILKNVIQTGKIFEQINNTILIDKNHDEKIVYNCIAPIVKQDNQIIGVVLVFRDITEQFKMEKELEKTNKLESLGILAGGIAHDFNNIITGILGNISLAMIEVDPNKDIYNILSEAKEAVLNAKELAKQLLTFAKGGAPIKKSTSIADTIKDSANFVLRGSNVQCKFFIEENLPFVEMDKGQINQVINNLILNAQESMPEGGIIKVKVENIELKNNKSIPLMDGRYVKIAISDEGIGIHEKYIQKIFDPYFTTKQKGNGLGLAISYSIIKRHEGYITVESKLGKGTTFYIYLPASEEKETTKIEELTNIIKGNERVLVMDDEELVRKVVEKMLKHLGYSVELANDGREAIDMYEKSIKSKNKIDIIIMDLTIPGKMGGEKAIKEIIKLDPSAKVIVSSGYSNDPIMANYKDYGFSYYISKPYRIEELSEVLHKVLINK